MTLVFVYGTLKRGGSNHGFLMGECFLGHARTVPGYTLYTLDGYPGMVPDASAEGVLGELWSVDAKCLAALDDLEGVSENLYRRAPIQLEAPFATVAAETYLYARPIAGRPHLGPTWPVQ
ncbi:MAG: gamma-glutamylcyclotransferase [Verrucomicrobia bacterium]|nr:gamma-glutamylcyclotransferase [Verrucomicrobiota bacterium]